MIFDVIRRADIGAAGKIFWIFAGLIFSIFAVLLYPLSRQEASPGVIDESDSTAVRFRGGPCWDRTSDLGITGRSRAPGRSCLLGWR
jgi:hypothetical protein